MAPTAPLPSTKPPLPTSTVNANKSLMQRSNSAPISKTIPSGMYIECHVLTCKGDPTLDDLTIEISKLAISSGSQKSKVSPKLLETLFDSLKKDQASTQISQDQPKDLMVMI